MKYFIETYGCQMNVYDSELISTILKEDGYEEAENISEAEIFFVNTCAVRENATERVINKLRQHNMYKRKGRMKIMGVLGCMPQHDNDMLKERLPFVDIFAGPDSYRRLPELIKKAINHKRNEFEEDIIHDKTENYDQIFPSRKEGTNAFIAITRGCNNFCTYCVVPYTRGRERSRDIDSILEEVNETIDMGFTEITLLGQNVNSYVSGEYNFPKLLKRISEVNGVRRLRFATSHPKDLDDELIEVIAEKNNICNNFHIPFQSGSNKILRDMNRGYTIENYLDKIDKLKNAIPGITLTTDIIIGFPGETDEDFQKTLDVVGSVGYDNAFTFIYSERKNTAAERRFPDNVPKEIKAERMQKLTEVQKNIGLSKLREDIGKVKEVLVESKSKKREWQLKGRTEENRIVIFDGRFGIRSGDYVNVRIKDAEGITLFGELIDIE
ncbi:MAG: tRNA (N6-isopentenyl adenosine(37)-C2)-methylthiotransferase MiaB [Candidatus Delongbacteria bacterium]|nr:tRNA (N6-isopentenyl adenosine(37)-C2)-methylthiotransferase MiaB [Candidatus Delongbacteria bacterium]MBN2833934.1 tRNA (N6-isopentenyl adenosine(37)-C2)-methylthiotransferase MiaB [Candidatus Delongbacteria bacterium]